MITPEGRLAAQGIVLPEPAQPVANYASFVRTGSLLFISGQLPLGPDGKLSPRHVGKLGREIFHEGGQEAARLCAINLLAQAKLAVGELSRLDRCVRLGGFVNCMPDFNALAAVMNGASDLMVLALGERGRHARSTIGAPQLPLDSAVEVEALFSIL